MAALCLMLIACEQQDLTNVNTDAELNPRSVLTLTVNYLDASDELITVLGDSIGITYLDQEWSELAVYAGSSVYKHTGNNLQISSISGYGLLVTIDDNEPISMDSIEVDNCAPELCYQSFIPSSVGSGMTFIVEDGIEAL